MLAGLSALMAFARLSGAQWPPLRDIALASLATAVMVFALRPLRDMDPGAVALALETVCGVAIYGAFTAVFDIAGLRTTLVAFVKAKRAKFYGK